MQNKPISQVKEPPETGHFLVAFDGSHIDNFTKDFLAAFGCEKAYQKPGFVVLYALSI